MKNTMALFLKECRKIFFSLTFLIYCVAVFAMYFTQFQNDCVPIDPPKPGQDDYGTVAKEVPELVMSGAAANLVSDYLEDSYVAYPIGFYKDVHLNEKKKQKMAAIITEITGITKEELDSFTDYQEGGYLMDENGEMSYFEPVLPEIEMPASLTYERFRTLMREADDIIGGGSDYSDENIIGNFSRVPKTYEDALAEYEQFFTKDKITGAYGRLYCDYMGIVLAVLPVFVAVSLTALDKKSRMEQLAYSRKLSSAKLVFTRFFALLVTMLIPVVLTAVIAQVKVSGLYPDSDMDKLAIFRYAAIWLIPNIMTAAAVGMLMTELTSSMLAIFVQGVWWASSIFTATGGLTGNIGTFTLVARHNSLYGLDVFMAHYSRFVCNRVFFTVVSLAAVVLTAFIYEQKRRGSFHGHEIRLKAFKH